MKRTYLKHLALFLFTSILLSILGYYFLEQSIKGSILWGVITAMVSSLFFYWTDKEDSNLRE